MTVLLGDNFTITQSVKNRKLEPGQLGAHVHTLREKISVAGAANLVAADTIKGPFLPEGAIILRAFLQSSAALTSGGTFDLGLGASTLKDGSVLAADPDSLIDGADLNAAVKVESIGSEAAFVAEMQLGSQAQVIATYIGTSNAVTATLQFVVEYTLA